MRGVAASAVAFLGAWKREFPVRNVRRAAVEVRFSEVAGVKGEPADFVNKAVSRLEDDLDILDTMEAPKLRAVEKWPMIAAMCTASFFSLYPCEIARSFYRLVIPVCTAVVAAVGTAEETQGFTNAANAHEIGAVALRAAFEAEAILSSAERTKSILPVCVVSTANALAFSLISSQAIDVLFEDVLPLSKTPGSVFALADSPFQDAFVQTFGGGGAGEAMIRDASLAGHDAFAQQTFGSGVEAMIRDASIALADATPPVPDVVATAENLGVSDQLRTSLLLVCPVVSILFASVASLAQRETVKQCVRAQALGRRRFATRRDVGRTWRSVTQLVRMDEQSQQQSWLGFAAGLVPGPLVAALAGGGATAASKAILATATAAAQVAYYLTVTEYALARASESVASKSRTAALAEAWSKQAKRSRGRVPARSALAGLCLALSALSVEIAPRPITVVFPFLGSLFVQRAVKFKLRTKMNVDAASAAADKLAGLEDGTDDDALLPLVLTYRNLASAIAATRDEFNRRRLRAAVRVRLWFRSLVEPTAT